MKKTHHILIITTVALLFSACQTVETPDTSWVPQEPFRAEIADAQTRTYIDGSGTDIRMHWTANDEISLFYSTYGLKYLFQGQTGDRGGIFLPETSGVFTAGFELNRYYAIYPYKAENGISQDCIMSTTLPETQTWASGSFGPGTAIMTAVTTSRNDYNLVFYNVMSFLKLSIYGGKTVSSIILQGNNGEPLSGQVEIDVTTGNEPALSFVSGTTPEATITLDCPGGVVTGADADNATDFIIALPPTLFSGGFSVRVTDSEGVVTTRTTTNPVTFARNHIKPMAAFTLDATPAPEPPQPVIPDLPEVNSGLPVLYVYTPDGVPVVSKDEWIANSHAYLKNTDGTVEDLGTASIKGRGNTTWNYIKKPYAFKLDKKKSLLGMPSDKRWNLLANYIDRTRLRNDLALELGRRLAANGIGFDWTPRGKFVELVLNDVHLGNYYLVEHIKVASNRVPITEMKATDIEGEAITGGYLIESSIEFDELNKFWTNGFPDVYPYNRHGKTGSTYRLPIMVKSPDDDVMVPAQLAWLQSFINSVESRIVANNSSWLDDVDMDSFICWMIVQEVVGNYEPFHPKSAYMHKDRGGKLMMGPLWDFDYGTFKNDYAMTPVYHYSIWYPYMLHNSAFKARVIQLWPSIKAVLNQVCSEYSSFYTSSNPDAMPLAVSIDQDWVNWKNLGGQPSSNGDEELGVWAAFSRLTYNLQRRINQMQTEIDNNIPNM
ncbi:MAG: CotH kinase family protein [Bacteroidales bacterium]|nr:CotH kinase family protein [Bacteroidales bacterium]